MNLDKKRVAAVRTLELLGYTWEGGTHWKPPLGAAIRPAAPLSEYDFELLCTTVRRVFLVPLGNEQAAQLFSEIRAWGWFK